MLNILRPNTARRRLIRRLYDQLVSRARAPVFYAALQVPDSLDGRFDMLALHAFLLLERVKQTGDRPLSQGLMDALFIGLDEALRDMGAGDMGMGRKMKKMANAFYGRMKAYGEAGDETALADAVVRNIYRGEAGNEKAAAIIAGYMVSARAHLAQSDITTGAADFGPLPQVQI